MCCFVIVIQFKSMCTWHISQIWIRLIHIYVCYVDIPLLQCFFLCVSIYVTCLSITDALEYFDYYCTRTALTSNQQW